jgi:adenylosuccinate lyase
VTPALENVALWHERDISHSSVERMIGPDATITLDFALARLTGVIDKLLIYPERMLKNLNKMGGLIHSQRVLLALTQAGASREDSYRLVQRNAMKVWESDGALQLLDLLAADPEPRPRHSTFAAQEHVLHTESAPKHTLGTSTWQRQTSASATGSRGGRFRRRIGRH